MHVKHGLVPNVQAAKCVSKRGEAAQCRVFAARLLLPPSQSSGFIFSFLPGGCLLQSTSTPCLSYLSISFLRCSQLSTHQRCTIQKQAISSHIQEPATIGPPISVGTGVATRYLEVGTLVCRVCHSEYTVAALRLKRAPEGHMHFAVDVSESGPHAVPPPASSKSYSDSNTYCSLDSSAINQMRAVDLP